MLHICPVSLTVIYNMYIVQIYDFLMGPFVSAIYTRDLINKHDYYIILNIYISGVALMCSQRKNGKSIIYLCSQFLNFVQSIFQF